MKRIILLLVVIAIVAGSCGDDSGRIVAIDTEFGTMTFELSDETPLHRDNFLKLAEEGYYDGLLFHRIIPGFMAQGGDPDSRGAAPEQRLGNGGPGYTIPNEIKPTLHHFKGALAAARTGGATNPNRESSGSQFYVVHGTMQNDNQLNGIEQRWKFQYSPEARNYYKQYGGTAQLDMDYTVFGYMREGFDVIDKLANVPTSQGIGGDRPLQDVKMTVRIVK